MSSDENEEEGAMGEENTPPQLVASTQSSDPSMQTHLKTRYETEEEGASGGENPPLQLVAAAQSSDPSMQTPVTTSCDEEFRIALIYARADEDLVKRIKDEMEQVVMDGGRKVKVYDYNDPSFGGLKTSFPREFTSACEISLAVLTENTRTDPNCMFMIREALGETDLSRREIWPCIFPLHTRPENERANFYETPAGLVSVREVGWFGSVQMCKLDLKNLLDWFVQTDKQEEVTVPISKKGTPTSAHQDNMPIFQGGSVPGTLDQETLQLRIEEAKKVCVKTKTYSHAQRILDQYRHVTICGASGEGKTTMSLMLARDYMKKGYQTVFVENIDRFDFSECISSSPKLVLILDDMFGTVGLSTDIVHLRNILDAFKTHIQHCNHDRVKPTGEHDKMRFGKDTSTRQREQDKTQKQKPETQKSDKDIRVVFTSKTYNFQEGVTHLKYQSFSLFTGQSVINLTANKEFSFSNEAKVAIFERHKTLNPSVSVQDVTKEDVLGLDETLFGFPQTCKLFFEFPVFRSNAKDFFKRPLFYLRMELSRIMDLNNNQTAALILMLLCEDKLDLTQLELQDKDKTMDDRFKLVTNIIPTATRLGIAKAARRFRGTFFTFGDMMHFAHSSIYDACACVMYENDPSFVLKYCSYDFLFERLKSGVADQTGASEHLHFIFVSENYHDLIATRLADGVNIGHFSKTITHPILKNKHVAQLLLHVLQTHSIQSKAAKTNTNKKNIAKLLLTKLRTKKKQTQITEPSWAHMKDKEKCFLYWTAIGYNSQIISEMEAILKITFTQAEILEALQGCAETNNLEVLQFLLPKLDRGSEFLMRSTFLLLSAENASWDVIEFLLKDGCDFTLKNKYKRNIFHVICMKGKSNILRKLIESHGTQETTLMSLDEDGRTPIMLAVLAGSMECFELLNKISDFHIMDKYGDCLIHLACSGGNTDVIQNLLVSSNINSRGGKRYTPIMKAAVTGQQKVFDLLVSHNADLTLLDNVGDSLLHLACLGGNTEIVQHILTSYNINSRGQYGWTPIMIAAHIGQQGVFDLLVSHNADLTLLDDGGTSLLHLACQCGNTESVRHLLTSSNINCRGRNEWTPIMIAAVEGQQGVFDLLASHNADLTLLDVYGDSLLHLACHGGNKEIVRNLLTSSNINSRGQKGWTPLMFAAFGGHINIIDYLVENQADLKLVDDVGDSLLHLASQDGNTQLVRHLLTSSNINSRGKHERTPIMVAALNGQNRVFDLLVSHNADLTLVDDVGESLIHLACLGGNTEIVQHILTSSNINSRGKHERTPIMVAALNGQNRVFDLLVSHNADLTLVDDVGESLIHLACLGGNTEIVQHILTSSDINSRGQYGWTPIMIAAHVGQQGVFDLLVSYNADLTLLDDGGTSLLHLACQGGNTESVLHLLTSSNINHRGRNEWTPIMIAAVEGQQGVFDLLASHNADLTLLDDYGDSLLHLACHGGNKEIVRNLLTSSNINSRGQKGWTPLMFAAFGGHINIIDYLVENQADLRRVDDYGRDVVSVAQDEDKRPDVAEHLKTLLKKPVK